MRARAAEGQSPISIHALLAESDRPLCSLACTTAFISIHALLAESDVWTDTDYNLSDIISIHALLAESDGLFYVI